MVTTTLTKEMIGAGADLVKKLDEKGVQPEAAFWFYFPDIQQWELVLAEVKLGSEGPREIYERIQDVLFEFSEELKELSLDTVTLAKPDAPIVALLRVAIRTGPAIAGIRFMNNVINGVVVEDAYVCRLQ